MDLELETKIENYLVNVCGESVLVIKQTEIIKKLKIDHRNKFQVLEDLKDN